MQPFASGAAFVDRSGAVVADPGFVARLGLDAGDPSGGLAARASADPALRALLDGAGPHRATIADASGARCELERVPSGSGSLLLLRASAPEEWLDGPMRSQALARVIAGVVHDIRNPLNAMGLQAAILSEKLAAGDGGAVAAQHLGAMREQIGRVSEILRRVQDVTEPGAPLGYTDVGAIVVDLGALFTHEARRRGIAFQIEAQPGVARTSCEPAAVGRLLLGLFARALADTPDGGRFVARADARNGTASVTIEHAADDRSPALGYDTEVAAATAAALGGEFAQGSSAGIERISLALPRNEP